MKKSINIGNSTFLHFDGESLHVDSCDGSAPYPLTLASGELVLDFSYDPSARVVRVVTSAGRAVTCSAATHEPVESHSFGERLISASIHRRSFLAVTAAYKAKVMCFDGRVTDDYAFLEPSFRFCLMTGQIRALADSSCLMVLRAGRSEWERYKFRTFYITNLVSINRQIEFGLITTNNTRIFKARYQTKFRAWAQHTACLIQCPCTRHFYAHLDSSGVLRVGDSESDFALQETGVSGVCWNMGTLWVRSGDGRWRGIVLCHNDELFDLRLERLQQLEAPLIFAPGPGAVADVLAAFRERPALSKEMLRVLRPLSQNLQSGIIVQESKCTLDSYIKKGEQINRLLGQIDFALRNIEESNQESGEGDNVVNKINE